MQVLFIVINHEQHFNDILEEFKNNNIRGGTIIDSEGMAQSLAYIDPSFSTSYLKVMLNQGRPYNKTIFLLLNDEKLEVAKECVRRAVGNLNKENVGIMFTFEVTSFEGLTK